MSAALKPIEARAVERPAYDNTHVAQGALWMRDNDAALKGYYTALGGQLPQASDGHLAGFTRAERFLTFACVQWDRQRFAL